MQWLEDIFPELKGNEWRVEEVNGVLKITLTEAGLFKEWMFDLNKVKELING